jgi:hypothetical protein
MESNLESVLERIANALERQNQLLENKEFRQIKLDKLTAEKTKLQIKESKVIKTTPRINKEG